MSNRKMQFERREQLILETAEQLLLESGDYDLTLDGLAQRLDLAKGTLYKHFSSKDELLVRLLIEYENRLYHMNVIDDGAGAGVARMVLQLLLRPQRAMMFHLLEDKLSATTSGLNRLFSELYKIRRERMKRMYELSERYLAEQGSKMMTRDFLASIWALGQGGAGLLNSSFYQRYLGDRDTLKFAFVVQMLDLPKFYGKESNNIFYQSRHDEMVDADNSDTAIDKNTNQAEHAKDMANAATTTVVNERATPKLIKPLMPPMV